jgi:hypothetical protein
MRTRPCIWIPALAAILAFAGCKPSEPPQSDYESACYGGDYHKSQLDSFTFVTVDVRAPERDWPRLRDLLMDYGIAKNLYVFNTSLNQESVHVFDIALCDPGGLYVHASKQNWTNATAYDPNPGSVNIIVSAYALHERWRPFAREITAQLEQSWPDKVSVSWRPGRPPASPSTAD